MDSLYVDCISYPVRDQSRSHRRDLKVSESCLSSFGRSHGLINTSTDVVVNGGRIENRLGHLGRIVANRVLFYKKLCPKIPGYTRLGRRVKRE